MFEVLKLFFAWLPPPLGSIVFGAFCILLLIAVIKLIAKIIDMIPFL